MSGNDRAKRGFAGCDNMAATTRSAARREVDERHGPERWPPGGDGDGAMKDGGRGDQANFARIQSITEGGWIRGNNRCRPVANSGGVPSRGRHKIAALWKSQPAAGRHVCFKAGTPHVTRRGHRKPAALRIADDLAASRSIK